MPRGVSGSSTNPNAFVASSFAPRIDLGSVTNAPCTISPRWVSGIGQGEQVLVAEQAWRGLPRGKPSREAGRCWARVDALS